MLHTETVESRTLDLIKQLMQDTELDAFNLVGGTALSLKLGHRKSIDIDLFTDKDFDADRLAKHLVRSYDAEIVGTIKNGVFGYIKEVKIDVIAHQYPVANVETIDGIRMLSLEDIGAMKLTAILYNGTRLKDFVDVYSLLEQVPLKTLTEALEKKYPNVNKQMAHNALLFHRDVKLRQKIDFIGPDIPWPEISNRLQIAVANTQKIFKNKIALPDATSSKSLKKSAHRRRKRGPNL